ncbi:type II secretion system protein N [Aliiglaciecola sp. LCG003]|uniref:type II secretion system protein N n=1 Tax=Aliiglaciecola sp. LCG003 TaxID=3053655 RepID=UPI002573077F|nr:type II secretion system protein N [Aliiglaciecola sp. LCG003]WJG08506.1 type II secretion system protein N [Aliiglaciecola sp. LCG003]
MSDSPNSNSKLILSALALAIAILAYFMFFNDSRAPIELTEEAKLITQDRGKKAVDVVQQASSSQAVSNPLDLKSLIVTPLDLTLLGVVSSDKQHESSATIQSRLQVRTYFIGDQIAYTNATLIEIRSDRVVILNQGDKQVLLIRGSANSTTNNQSDSAEKTAPQGIRNNDISSSSLALSIGNRPKRLEHIVILLGNQTNGNGLIVSPGLNPKLFKSAGFKEGDLLQKVNGFDVDSEDGLNSIQQTIENAQTLVFSVLRGGKIITLYLDIPSENLELKLN